MKTRILAISNHSFMLGGGEHAFLDLLSRLPAPWSSLAVLPGQGELATRLEKRGIRTQVIPLPSIRPWHLLNILSSLVSYFILCRRYRPALIYANGSRAALYGGIVGRMLKIPVIWHCRIADPDIYLDFILRRLGSKIVANSQATGRRFRGFFQSKVRVVYNGVDIAWLRDKAVGEHGDVGDGWKVLLVVARISKWKRHDIALTAFEHVGAFDPNVHLVCVGSRDVLEPEWWEYLQNRTYQSAFSNRIHWVGREEDVRPWYRAACMLLLPSENEPFGRVLVEAMACGVPVVASRSGGVPEVVRHHQDGILVAPGKGEEFAGAVSEILKNALLRRHLAESAMKRAEAFSLSAHVKSMVSLFEEVIKNTSRTENSELSSVV